MTLASATVPLQKCNRVGNSTMLSDQLSKITTAITVVVMFVSLWWLRPQIANLAASYAIAASAGSALASVGIYRLFGDGLLWVFKRSQNLRRLMLGKAFLEGTWVGHYKDADEHRFTIEHIDQASGTTVIRGREFDSAGKTRAAWSSDTVSIDTGRMQLVYAYTCKVFDRKHVQEGLGVFSIVCEVGGKPAQKLDGYAVDLIDGDRDPNTEHKISQTETSDQKALSEARKLFNVPLP